MIFAGNSERAPSVKMDEESGETNAISPPLLLCRPHPSAGQLTSLLENGGFIRDVQSRRATFR